MGLNCFIILKEVMDGGDREYACEQSVLRAVGIYYCSSVFIKSDNKAVTLSEGCVYTRLDFYVSLLFHWFQKVKTPKPY